MTLPSLGRSPPRAVPGRTLYFGPKAPDGKAGNWPPTVPGKAYLALLRLYFPTETAIDKSWGPSDFEEVKIATGCLGARSGRVCLTSARTDDIFASSKV